MTEHPKFFVNTFVQFDEEKETQLLYLYKDAFFLQSGEELYVLPTDKFEEENLALILSNEENIVEIVDDSELLGMLDEILEIQKDKLKGEAK